MLLSMTGFGKSVVDDASRKITVEVKSLNSKQLDVSSRVPALYREIEIELRNRVGHRLERGKVDLTVSVDNIEGASSVTINVAAIADYRRQLQQLAATLGIPEPADWYSVLMRFPDALRPDVSRELTPDDVDAVNRAVDQAVDRLMDHRRAEGIRLEEFFTVRINRISELLALVPRYEAERVAKIRARIEEGLSKIKSVDIDKARLEQEMIFYIEKLDINEEKQRLGQHLNYFLETLAAAPGQGKKLGFIAQEMGREINTLGSKSNHAELQRIVVKMKDELEQIKEQVLNVM